MLSRPRLFMFLALFALIASPAAQAQVAAPAPVSAAPPEEVTNPIAKPTEFSELGAEIAKPKLKLPAGIQPIRLVSAPFGENGEAVLAAIYKSNGVVFADLFTAKDGQPWVQRNHVRLQSPLPIRPEKMSLNLRYLEPQRKRGFLLVATDEAGHLAIALPKGFGGTVVQQQFLTASTASIKRTYDFSQIDSRGFVSVKATVDSTGRVKPSNETQLFVWNGKLWIPRKAN